MVVCDRFAACLDEDAAYMEILAGTTLRPSGALRWKHSSQKETCS